MWRAPMENDYEVNIVPLEMDRDAEASAESQSESTLSNSLESGLTVKSSGGDADSKLDESTGWTNEKHNSYLDYLENSFVRQLYSLLGGEEQTRRLSTTRHVQSNTHNSTDQFTILQNGCRQKVNFVKKRAYIETLPEFHFQKNSSGLNPENLDGKYTIGTAVQGIEETENSCDEAFTRTSMRNSLGHEYPAQCTAEASGQNFREEEVEEKGCNSGVSKKRRREAKDDESSLNDQVVP